MMPMPSRNSLCPCGSGRKFKRCCLVDDPLGDGTFVVTCLPEDPSTVEGREGIMRYKREMNLRWLDEDCMALGGLTPRQAARLPAVHPALRQELLFKEEIEDSIVSPECRISLDFLWQELGLAREPPADC
jgi:hypothetical protein